MPITAHDASIAVFVRGLTSLRAILRKAEAQATARGISTAELLEARLAPPAPDMLPLASQAHWVAESTKRTVERLVGAPIASVPDDAKTFAELHQRIDAAITLLQTISADALEASLKREIEVDNRRGKMRFTGDRFLLEFALPHFYYHLTAAYAILRHRGIELTMADFLGRVQP